MSERAFGMMANLICEMALGAHPSEQCTFAVVVELDVPHFVCGALFGLLVTGGRGREEIG
jgi:hypothetical protein